jgi:drug/metabolite transporter (DMT)-like permease
VTSTTPRQAALGVVAIAVSWGLIGVLVRWIGLPALVLVPVRCWLATATIGLIAWIRLGWRGAVSRLRGVSSGVVVTGAILAVHWLFLAAAQQRAPIGTVLLLTYIAPVIVAVLAPRLLGEVVAPITYVALALAMAGTLLLARPSGGDTAGIVLALLAGASYAALTLVSKKVVAGVGGVCLAFVQLGVAAAVLTPFALFSDPGEASWSWGWLLLLAVVLTGLLGPAYLALLDRLPASTIGVLMYLEPCSAVVMAWVFLDEVPTAAMVAGGTLVVAAGIMVVLATSRVANRERSNVDRVPG